MQIECRLEGRKLVQVEVVDGLRHGAFVESEPYNSECIVYPGRYELDSLMEFYTSDGRLWTNMIRHAGMLVHPCPEEEGGVVF